MFDLEKAIRLWRKRLQRSERIEDGQIAELESHIREEIEQLTAQGVPHQKAFEKASHIIGNAPHLGNEFYKSNTRYGKMSFALALPWNYFKLALRKLKLQRGYSFINITGLAVGIACCLFILMYVRFELSFDSHHQDVDRIYNVGQSRKSQNGIELARGNFPLMAPTLKERFPQVQAAAAINQGWIVQVKYQDKVFKEQALWHADPGVFEVLTIPFIRGNPRSALERPLTAVLSEIMGKKYFADNDPMGKTIQIGNDEFEITGIIQDPPLNSDFRHKIIMSWATIAEEEHWQGWSPGMAATVCLIKLRPEIDAKEFEALISELPREYCAEKLDEMGQDYRNILFDMRSHHRISLAHGEIVPSARMIMVYIFSAVALLILLIACMNFMNLATARSAGRATEVGIRKVVGAQRRQIVRQFIAESLLVALISLILAVMLVQLGLPFFNRLAQTGFSSRDLWQPGILAGMFGLLLVVGIAAGSYPAFILSAFRPIAVLRGNLKSGAGGALMRKILVVGQFTISIALVISTLIIYTQIKYMKNQSLGFDKEQKIVIPVKGWRMMTDNYETIKNEYLKNPSIINATAASGIPGSMINRTWVYPTGKEDTYGQAFRSLRCDHDFTKVYGLEMVAGRPFNKKLESDTIQSIIINESGVKAFGWDSPEEALGKELWDQKYPVIGVVKDYHWWGLQREIEPMLMRVVPELFRSVTLTVDTKNLPETIAYLQETYQKFFPGDLFEYHFVDAIFDLQYQAEERISRIFRVFTGLAIFIACLGLFGMASFIAQKRTKEIGIRKVLGASVGEMVLLLSREFSKWVLAANLLAWPIAYFIGQKWLQSFAYKIQPGWEIFFLSGLGALLIAVITVSYQSVRTAISNPVDALRYE